MYRLGKISLCFFTLASFVTPTLTARPLKKSPITITPDHLRCSDNPGPNQTVGSFILVSYDFDDSLGYADPQGWNTLDLTTQDDTFFHVDDFAGLPPPYAPLEGTKSLWCGADGSTCASYNFATPPGYGEYWNQYFVSIPLSVTGDATISFKVFYDCEPSYDHTYLEYRTTSGRWDTLLTFTGTGQTIATATAPAESLAGSVQFRFQFLSDYSYSDEDGDYPSNGAVVIDSLVISDGQGVVDYQDFESEINGARSTLDGHWVADVAPPFGDYAALVKGDTVMQEDPGHTNSTHMWAFFNKSDLLYECGLKPQLAVPPYQGYVHNEAIDNMAVSPWLDLTPYYGVQGCSSSQDTVTLLYDQYYDNPEILLLLWNWGVRFKISGDRCPTPWRRLESYYVPWPYKVWIRSAIREIVPLGAIAVQVGVGATDFGYLYHLPYCHHHAPLHDNVQVRLTKVYPTGTGMESPPNSLALHQNYPNPFNPITTIRYEVPREGVQIRIAVYDVSGRLVRVLFDGPAHAGLQKAVWDGRNAGGEHVASGIYFCRMKAGAFEKTRKMVLMK